MHFTNLQFLKTSLSLFSFPFFFFSRFCGMGVLFQNNGYLILVWRNKLIQWWSRIFDEHERSLSWSCWSRLKNHPQAARKLVRERPLHGHLGLLHLADDGGLELGKGGKEEKAMKKITIKTKSETTMFEFPHRVICTVLVF